MPITMLDAIVAAVIFISAFLAMVRGFSREVLSLASWGLAALSAWFAYPHILPYVSSHIANEMVALIVVLAGVFIVALLVIFLLTMKVADLIIDSELIRPENRPAWIEQAVSKSTLDQMAVRLGAALPSDLAEKLLLKLEKKRETDDMTQDEAGGEVLEQSAIQ